jgi:hypothetical protein
MSEGDVPAEVPGGDSFSVPVDVDQPVHFWVRVAAMDPLILDDKFLIERGRVREVGFERVLCMTKGWSQPLDEAGSRLTFLDSDWMKQVIRLSSLVVCSSCAITPLMVTVARNP